MTMYTKKQFNEMTFYLESCESGSMFKNILSESIKGTHGLRFEYIYFAYYKTFYFTY